MTTRSPFRWIADRIDALDQRIAAFMRDWGIRSLRLALAGMFLWFGILKPLGLSPAAPLVMATVEWMPWFSPPEWLVIIGWWEVATGATFLFHRTVRIAIALMMVQMVGYFLPLVLLPDVTFQAGHVPYAPTMEGQYILKDLVVLAAALVVGGTVRREHRRTHRAV